MKAQLLPVFILILFSSCRSGYENAHDSVSLDSLRAVVSFLASDECEGRLPFTDGADRACDFIAARMLDYGLSPIEKSLPLSTESYKQYVPLLKIESLPSGIMDIYGESGRILRYLEDFTAFNGLPGKTEIDGELVFAGYGIVSPEYGKNDYAGISDPQDKIALVIVNDPGLGSDGPYFNGNSMTYYGRWTYKFEEGFRQGLKGVLIIHDDLGAGYGWNTVTAGAHVKYALDDGRNDGLALEGWLSAPAARGILEDCGFDVDSLFMAAKSVDFVPCPLNAHARLSIENRFTKDSSPNIVGYIPGKTDECVVCTAHWDHLGIKSSVIEGDNVCNGATDNATAVAWLLETARVLKSSGIVPRRNIVFLAPTTEELGMWGSEFYASHPIFASERTAAVVNKDVIPLWGESNDVTVTGYGYSDMDSLLAEIASGYGCYLMPDPESSNGMFYRSDHLPFMRRGIPAMFAKGWSDSREHGSEWSSEKIRNYWNNIYHTVDDEISPDDDYSGLKQEVDIFLDFIMAVADSDYWPQWSDSSEFQR